MFRFLKRSQWAPCFAYFALFRFTVFRKKKFFYFDINTFQQFLFVSLPIFRFKHSFCFDLNTFQQFRFQFFASNILFASMRNEAKQKLFRMCFASSYETNGLLVSHISLCFASICFVYFAFTTGMTGIFPIST